MTTAAEIIDIGTQKETELMVNRSKVIEIKTDFDYMEAGEFHKTIKGMIKRIKSAFKPSKDKAKQAHSEIVALEKEFLTSLNDAESETKKALVAYDLKREEQRKAEEEARLKALREAEESKLEMASMAAVSGNEEKVKEIMETPEPELPIPTKPVTRGLSYRDNWKWELIDESKVPVTYKKLVIDQDKINKIVKEIKSDTDIDGIRVYNDRTLVSRSE